MGIYILLLSKYYVMFKRQALEIKACGETGPESHHKAAEERRVHGAVLFD